MFDVNVLYVVLFYNGVYMEKIYWVYCKKNGSLVIVLFGCDSLFVCCVWYGVIEFCWEGYFGVYF